MGRLHKPGEHCWPDLRQDFFGYLASPGAPNSPGRTTGAAVSAVPAPRCSDNF